MTMESNTSTVPLHECTACGAVLKAPAKDGSWRNPCPNENDAIRTFEPQTGEAEL